MVLDVGNSEDWNSSAVAGKKSIELTVGECFESAEYASDDLEEA